MPMPKTVKSTKLHPDVLALHQALSDLVRIYQFRDRTQICCHDVSVTQCYALEVLIRLGSVTMTRLAQELYLDKSTASRVVDALERKGYVGRFADPDDARAVNLEVTRKGRALYGKIERDLKETTARLASDFDPDICRATAELLARFARAAVERFAEEKSCNRE
jgi:DNA-binding MarR family transcriptional regulator